MAYLTNDDLKIYLEIDAGDETHDELLTALIARAQARIDRHCGQTFEASADTTRYFMAASVDEGGAVDGHDLILDAPLCQITSVTNGDGTVIGSGSYIKLPLNAARWYALRLKSSSNVAWTYDTDVESDLIAVVGRWAYSVTVPDDIVQAATLLSAWYYRRRENANDLDRTVITSGATLLPGRMPQDVMDILNNGYVRGPG
jgi:uncharacterized phiE125 gp8 family phage protein